MVARGFGWQARRVDRRAALDDALRECLDSDGPFFLDVRVAAEENCFPMMPAGRGHDEILLAADRPYRPRDAVDGPAWCKMPARPSPNEQARR